MSAARPNENRPAGSTKKQAAEVIGLLALAAVMVVAVAASDVGNLNLGQIGGNL